MASRLLILRSMNTIRGLYREGGIKAVPLRWVSKLYANTTTYEWLFHFGRSGFDVPLEQLLSLDGWSR